MLEFLRTFDRVYAYARVSSIEQADKRKSIEGQKARLLGVDPTPSILFEDVMGGDNSARPDYQRLRQQVRSDAGKGLKVCILVVELDRISRDNEEINDLIEELDNLNCALYALDGGMYTAIEPHEWLRLNQEGLFAEYYLRNLRRRLRASKRQRRLEGKPIFTKAPFGYLWTREKPIPDPENWETARKIIDFFLTDGNGVIETFRYAQSLGVPFKRRSSLSTWLSNHVLQGDLWYSDGGYNRQERKAGVKKSDKKKKLIRDTHEPLITRKEAQLIQAKREENRRYYGINRGIPRYPLSGLIYCGYCHYRMERKNIPSKSGGNPYAIYRCNNPNCVDHFSIGENILYRALHQELADRALALANLVVTKTDEIKSAEEIELEEKIKDLKKVYEAYKLEGVKAEIDLAEQELFNLRSNSSMVDTNSNERMKLLLEFREFENWEENDLSMAQKRALYHELVDRIIVTKNRNIQIMLQI